MKTVVVVLTGLVACAVVSVAQDSDKDGVPNHRDRAPYVAQYYKGLDVERVDPKLQPPTVDSDRDGVPDYLDRAPYVAQYYKGYAGEAIDYKSLPPTIDSDKDGVPDCLDRAPHVAQYYHGLGLVVEVPVVDGDGDGVVDDLDECPGTPAEVKVDARGCPLDSDGDGVADYKDGCLGTPAGVLVDADGCPLDTDKDGVIDSRDKCPNTPEGAPVDAEGCPLDSDADGIKDYLDKCPGTPAGIKVDETGCPVLIKKGEKIILDINFAANSSELNEASRATISGVAKTLLEFQDIRIAIRGFTDNTGSESHNRQLSDARANSVMGYLVELGVAENRMSAKGYGEDPQYFIGDNASAEGRAANRRVEIESVE
jgi:outer membrane protein OmpA-like peptidoglycan-associated protein